MTLSYGMFVQPGMVAAVKGDGHQFGMYASSQGGIQALLKHTSAVRFVCSPFAVDDVRREVMSVGGPRVERVEHLGDLIKNGQGETNAWIDFAGDVVRPHRFRRRIGGTYPIGVIQHSVSYGYALHSWFLPLLLGDVRVCDSILCTTTAARESIRKILDHVAEDMNAEHGTHLKFKGRLDIVPAGIDVEHFKPVSKMKARKRFGISQDDVVIFFAGRISAQDKADLAPFMRVFADLVKARPNLRLVLAGAARGNELQVLGKLGTDLGVMSRVTALGLVPHELLPDLYSAADVFVSPADSMPETFGLTCVEAMACGVPVIASDWNGYRDTVVHGETGFLVPTYMSPDLSLADDFSEWSLPQGELLDVYAAAQATVVDVGKMREALAALIADPNLRQRMGEAGRSRVVEKYAWPVVVRQYDDLFEELRMGALPRYLDAAARVVRHPYTRTRLADSHSHYPTRVLVDETVVRVAGSAPLLNTRPHLGVISDDVATSIACLVESYGGKATIAQIVSGCCEPLAARMHVAWLLKNRYLDLS